MIEPYVALITVIKLATSGVTVELTPIEYAIWTVETNRCEEQCPKGDSGKARGPLQIHMICWESVCKETESYAQCEKLEYSLKIFRRTVKRFCNDKRLEMIYGRTPTEFEKLESYAKCWNGGANWWKAKGKKIKNLDRYWIKVQNALRERAKDYIDSK